MNDRGTKDLKQAHMPVTYLYICFFFGCSIQLNYMKVANFLSLLNGFSNSMKCVTRDKFQKHKILWGNISPDLSVEGEDDIVAVLVLELDLLDREPVHVILDGQIRTLDKLRQIEKIASLRLILGRLYVS